MTAVARATITDLDTICAYRTGEAEPRTYRRGNVADAEGAVPGWRFPVEELFT